MKYILLLLLIVSQHLTAQELSKQNRKTLAEIKKTVLFLADDKLEGRRTGSAGEKLAYEYISGEFKSNGLVPLGEKGTFIQPFAVNDGKELKGNNYLTIGSQQLLINEDYFPMPYAANGILDQSKLTFKPAVLFIHALMDSNKTNPHFDIKEGILNKIKDAEKDGATVFFIFDTASVNEKFDSRDKTPLLSIPAFYLTASGTKKYFNSNQKEQQISYNVAIGSKTREGHNVVGYINNGAKNTIILGAHYDHLGYGEDHNSLYTGHDPMVHNGADDNASGVAGLTTLSRWLKKSKLKKYNYVFIAFSGEELGLYGSKFFTENSPVAMNTINYMLNMDMIGRLNDSAHGVTIGGYGTSPTWGTLLKKEDASFRIKFDSSGSGPSDHTSFYRKDIPVLFFFTGAHSDYHKPTDDADKINYNGELAIINFIKKIITATDNQEKLVFAKTKETTAGKSSFKVSMGIMPDYTFEGNGVRVDGVSDNKPAQKAGIKTGDVVFQLGEHAFSDVQTYMQTLNKFNKGDATKVKLKRGTEELVLDIVF